MEIVTAKFHNPLSLGEQNTCSKAVEPFPAPPCILPVDWAGLRWDLARSKWLISRLYRITLEFVSTSHYLAIPCLVFYFLSEKKINYLKPYLHM